MQAFSPISLESHLSVGGFVNQGDAVFCFRSRNHPTTPRGVACGSS